jgi:hypothetical protein
VNQTDRKLFLTFTKINVYRVFAIERSRWADCVGIIQIRARIWNYIEYQRYLIIHMPAHIPIASPPTIISIWLDSPISKTTVTIPTPYPEASRYFVSEATYNTQYCKTLDSNRQQPSQFRAPSKQQIRWILMISMIFLPTIF